MDNCLNRQRLLDLDVMKVLAMILVVFGHVLTNYVKIGCYPDNVWLDSLKSFIYSFHMPAFVFVSGSVYFYSKNKKNKYNNYVEYVKNKFKRLFIPYCFFSIFVVFPALWLLGLIDNDPFKFFIANYVLSINPRHLWYVLMLFWIMLIFRLFNTFIDRRQSIVMVVCFFLCVLSQKIPNLFQLNTLCRYFVYFYLGYEFLRYKDNIVKYISFYSFCLFAFLSVLLCTLNVTNEYINIIVDILSSLAGIAWLYILSNILSKTCLVKTNLFFNFSHNTYGIYLFHPVIIYFLLVLTRTYHINLCLQTFFVFLISIIISYALTAIFRKINLKWAIGE